MKNYVYLASPQVPTMAGVAQVATQVQEQYWEFVSCACVGVEPFAVSRIAGAPPVMMPIYECLIRGEVIDGKAPDAPEIKIQLNQSHLPKENNEKSKIIVG